MNIEKFEKDMAVFSFAHHQDVLTYLIHLEKSGWTLKDVKEWIEEKRRLLVSEEKTLAVSYNCPKCNTFMRLLPVNFTRATLTEDDSQSVWLCPNSNCMHTIYNKESVEELSQKGGK